jgi:hypothetical protein
MARKCSSGIFVFWELHPHIVETEEVPVLRDHLARKLNRGLLAAPNPEEYAQKLSTTKRLGALSEQPLARSELRRQLLDGVPTPHKLILLLDAS